MAALTKAQQAEMDKLREDVRLARALSWPTFPRPEPMPNDPKLAYGKLQEGWEVRGDSVVMVYFNSIGVYKTQQIKSGSKRNYHRIFATQQDAVRERIWDVAIECAHRMARAIDLLNSTPTT